MHKIGLLFYNSSAEHSHALDILVFASINIRALQDFCRLVNSFMPEDSHYYLEIIESEQKHIIEYYHLNSSDLNYSFQKDSITESEFHFLEEKPIPKRMTVWDGFTHYQLQEILHVHFSNLNTKEMKANMLKITKAKKSGRFYQFPDYFNELQDSIY